MHHLKIYFYGVLWQKGRFRCFIKEQPWFSEKAMAPHSSTLAWKIPWTGEPGGLQSMGSQRVGHDWATSLSCIGEGTGNPLQCSSLENPRDRGALWAAIYGVTQSRTRLKRLSNLAAALVLANPPKLFMWLGFCVANDVHGLQDRLESTWEEPKAKDRRPGFSSDLLHDLGEVMATSSSPLPVPHIWQQLGIRRPAKLLLGWHFQHLKQPYNELNLKSLIRENSDDFTIIDT